MSLYREFKEQKVTADAVDFTNAAANLNQHANIIVNRYEELTDADLVIYLCSGHYCPIRSSRC